MTTSLTGAGNLVASGVRTNCVRVGRHGADSQVDFFGMAFAVDAVCPLPSQDFPVIPFG
jgi:hypothetical protein